MAALLLFCAAYYLAAALAIVLGYHRGLAHRAFRMPRGLEYVLVTLGLPAGTPVQWVGTHRHHHAHADGPADPHSPHLGGFWHAHCGWYLGSRNPFVCLLYSLAGPLRLAVDAWIRPRTNQAFNHLAGDAASDPYYALLSRPRPYALAMGLHIAIPFGAAFHLWGAAGLVAAWATLVFAYNCGDAINSVAHIVGWRPHGRSNLAANGWVMALLAFGDGWHANHHRYPGSARAGIGPWQLDLGWMAIRVLAAAGLARDLVVLPRDPDGAPVQDGNKERPSLPAVSRIF